MATYNGEKYIKEQLSSIMCQLGSDDEVIIGDDQSTDNTVKLINSFNDSRIKILVNEKNIGYVNNFENCLNRSTGEYIFISDQDDIWPPGRVQSMIRAMNESGRMVLVGGYQPFEISFDTLHIQPSQRLPTSLPTRGIDGNRLENLYHLFVGRRIPYFGSCMLLKRDSLKYILPFAMKRIGHDHWIAIAANLKNDISHLNEVVTFRRIHFSNITNINRNAFKKISSRLIWLNAIIKFLWGRS